MTDTSGTPARDDVDPGAPFGLYRLLAPDGEPEIIERVTGPAAEILDLGSGVGRIANELARRGHRVTAVDMNAAMLGEVRGAETIRSRIEELRLARRFDCVLLMSSLIDRPDAGGRHALLATCAAHVRPGGVVLVQRYGPDFGVTVGPPRRIGAVDVSVEDVRREGQRVWATFHFDAGALGHWTVRLDGVHVLSDEELETDLAATGLRLERWLDERRRWALARPVQT